ncbi:Cysteine desulfurase [Paraburkholderia graminis C4D1M]|jgi:selenocysteine lyase/cysteine desulfurase|uniref:Aminotransferase class V n=1 Tax=Paraburkholderia graminis (strain ATCC 700544 / DSM 17151 / LMG 18924 / NCIMB 13744 / C4D1M) TaxID=396598 RepID=B1G6U2_PARG4|nr:aminotransferase class V-fold PLP-dependent enzyme [Paraburkholderia graminis]EDT08162.1 aminotransferase class V [Paraburkholderia graminis C4D1M]CAB3709320.1 Cysteine desulfurase [Paraburkholderia graminis C4D1M]
MSSPLSLAAVDGLRALTPGAQGTIHFNHAGASLPSLATLEAIQAQLWREATIGPIEAGAVGREHSERARLFAARLLNARPAEIAVTTGNSPGWGAAFAALGPWRPGERILVGRHEWGGNLATMRLAAQGAGAAIEVIPSDSCGTVDPRALEAMLDERVRLIALTWLPANGGLINPAAAIGRVARRHSIPYFIDAAQAVGQLPIDVVEAGCDILTGAGRKALRGPRGMGLLYVRQDFLSRLAPAFVDTRSAPLNASGDPILRNDAGRFESSEASLALHCGLANALREALEIGIDTIRARIDSIARTLRTQLADIPGVTVLDQGIERSGLVAFNVHGLDPLSVQRSLTAQGITIGSNGVGYTPLDMEFRGLKQIARASVSYLTTESEIGKLLEGIRALTR